MAIIIAIMPYSFIAKGLKKSLPHYMAFINLWAWGCFMYSSYHCHLNFIELQFTTDLKNKQFSWTKDAFFWKTVSKVFNAVVYFILESAD
jgi:hypothetical protein